MGSQSGLLQNKRTKRDKREVFLNPSMIYTPRAKKAYLRDWKKGAVAAPPGPTARRLAGLSGSLAPLAQRAIKGFAECETADADSHPMPPTPEGRTIRQTVCLAAPALPVPRSIT